MDNKGKYKIQFNYELGKLFDFLIAIESGYNNGKQPNNSILEKRNIIPDPIIGEFFDKIWESSDDKTIGLSIFFTKKDDMLSYCFENFINKLKDIGNIQIFIEEFFSINHIVNLLMFYESSSKSNEYYEEILSNKENLIKKINSFDISEKMKWELIVYITSPEIVNDCLKELFFEIADKIELLYQEQTDLINAIKKSIIQKNTKNIDEFFLFNDFPILKREIDDTVAMTISVSLLHEILILCYPYNYILGINYMKLVENKNIDYEILQLYNRIKSISDIHRLKLLILLKDKEINSGELATDIGLANSTTSYHLDLLSFQRLLNKKKNGKNIAYTANKKAILELIEEIKELLT